MPLLNPSLSEMWQGNSVISGVAKRHETGEVRAPLSIKSVRSGEAWWRVDGRDYCVTPDTFLIVNADQPYSLTIHSAQATETYCLFFDSDLLPTTGEFSNSLQPKTGVLAELLRQPKLSEDAFVTAGCELMRLHGQRASTEMSLPHQSSATRAEIHRRLELARDLILSTPSGSLDLKQVASEACPSPFHFHRLFKAAYGRTPHNFVTEHRLRLAKRLLQTEECDLQTICYQLGFESVSSFSRLFKRCFGISPGNFRNKQDRTID